MYFKPKIFISSTFSLNKLRQRIKDFLESVGAEAILYEKDLTPSINNATYRKDILDADFVIFIFNEKYGTKTESGKSGTHEEWDIVRDAEIPKHVYLKSSKRRNSFQKEFINKNISKYNISYYYYENNEDLFKQLVRTTFTLARDITIHKIMNLKIEDNKIIEIAINRDYQLALQFIQEIDLLKNLHYLGMADLIETMILIERLSGWFEYFKNMRYNIFIDNNLNNLLNDIFNSYNEFNKKHVSLYTSNHSDKIVLFPERKFKTTTTSLKLYGDPSEQTKLIKLLDIFLDKCTIFERNVFMKNETIEKIKSKYIEY